MICLSNGSKLHETRVSMKNITFTAEEELIEKARDRARRESTSLNKKFREWLTRYVSKGNGSKEFESVMEKMSYARPGKKFTRDEMNER